eukprot:1859540-Rhodomonas_salina.1
MDEGGRARQGPLSPYALATRCPRMLLPGAGAGAGDAPVISAICLRACYAMSGTDMAYGAVRLARARQCPAMSGTDIAYATAREARTSNGRAPRRLGAEQREKALEHVTSLSGYTTA